MAPEVTLKGGFSDGVMLRAESCQADIRGKGVPDRGNSKHKGLERDQRIARRPARLQQRKRTEEEEMEQAASRSRACGPQKLGLFTLRMELVGWGLGRR